MRTRVYSQYTKKAAQLLGQSIQLYRKKRHLSAEEMATRAGITRNTLRKIEQGDMKCEMGLVFEVACILGIPLFDADFNNLDTKLYQTQNQLMLLPKHIYQKQRPLDDDF